MDLVPYPRRCTRGKATFTIRRHTAQVTSDSALPVCIRHKLKELDIPLRAVGGPARHPSCVIGDTPPSLPEPPRKTEGYRLTITANGIALAGADHDGLFWGLTTLQQLMNGTRAVPCVDIVDWPAFALRYHHDDISRKQVSKLADFKRIIRLLSYYKIKYYTPYMEDMLYLRSCPDIGEGRGRLTPRELSAIRAEAKRYNVTLFPTFSLIGHQENLLRNPRYRTYAREVFQEPSSFDPSKTSLRPFLRKVIRDVCELFPDSLFFHACFDETQGVNERELTAHADWCAREIASHGKTMLMWVDMWKNHFGIEHLARLSSDIVPVEWNYGSPREVERRYADAGVTPVGLAGYNNWTCFLPDCRRGKRNLDEWAGVMRRWSGRGFGASIWGDNGYENSRDLTWNLYAYLGETAWRGTKAAPHFEKRFQTTFYGVELPRLQAIVETLPRKLRVGPNEAWRWFRFSIQAMVRLCASDPTVARRCRDDLVLLRRALRSIPAAARRARREKEHLDHYAVALEREINVRERMVFASWVANGMSRSALRRESARVIDELHRVRALYRQVWLRHNKRENIEVSLGVYDSVAGSLRELLDDEPVVADRFICLELGRRYNAFEPAVAGLPIRMGLVGEVPFLFAPLTRSHCHLHVRHSATLRFERCVPHDIHLIYGGQTIDKKRPRVVVEVSLLLRGRVVFRERLRSITQICDWWAPLGEHMWAGGGYKYVDKRRSTYALKPGENYGLLHLHGFALHDVPQAGAVRITAVSKEDFNLFAVTIERRAGLHAGEANG